MSTPYFEEQDRLRREMAATPEGKFLAEIHMDYYDTESAARRVAEHAVKRLGEQRERMEQAVRFLETLAAEMESAAKGSGFANPANIARQARRIIEALNIKPV